MSTDNGNREVQNEMTLLLNDVPDGELFKIQKALKHLFKVDGI